MIKYANYGIALQEVPDEISLVFNISGCKNRCPECHSKYLWDDIGKQLTEDEINKCLDLYKDLITCICFMGGDHDIPSIKTLCSYVKKLGYKTCIYSGNNNIEVFIPYDNIDYLKIGNYDGSRGGLQNINTNQKMYMIESNKKMIDITYKFQTSVIKK